MKQLNAIANFCKQKKEAIYLNLDEIELHGGTQQRAKLLNYSHVETLEDALSVTEDLTPIEVVFDGETYYLTDGFHRYYAYKNQGKEVIPAHITEGTLRDAILASVAANAQNLALPRTRLDKQKAIQTMLNDPEWSTWSDREIAKQVGASHPTVSAIRKQLVNLPDRTFTRNGTTATMNTENIGRSVSQKADINDYTARNGHLYPKPESGETEGQSEKSNSAKPEPKSEAFVMKEWLQGFLSWVPKLPPAYISAIKNAIQEREEMETNKS